MEANDGVKDPLCHLESYHTHMVFQGVSNEIMCKVFPTILKGVARRWFSMLQPGSVGSFTKLCQRFMSQLIGGRIRRIPTTYLLNLKQKKGETLKEYMVRFNKEMFLVDRHDEQVVLAALVEGIWPYIDFMKDLEMNPHSALLEFIDLADKNMKVEDTLKALKD
jgi:hypothetical protein